jgi:Ser/Thr protein kinase RdoA (MazF antagonist)
MLEPSMRRLHSILAAAGLRHARIRRLHGNSADRVFAVRCDGGRFVLRCRATPMSTSSAQLQRRWLESIARGTDLTVPTSAATAGKLSDGAMTLMTWVPGRRTRDAGAFVQPRRLDAVGMAAATLHRHAQRFDFRPVAGLRRLDARFFFGADSCVGALGRAKLSARDSDHLRRWAARIRRAMAELGESRPVFGLVHNDLEPPNWVFRAGRACPIDFDMFGVGYYLHDLAQVLWTHAMWTDYPACRNRLLAAYERVRTLGAVECRHAKSFEALPLIDWISRKLRVDAEAELERWLPATMKLLRSWWAASPANDR